MPGETEETRKRFNPPVSRPSPSGAPTAPPGERGGQGTVGANEVQWKSTPQSREEYYAPGGQGQTNLNISNPAYPNYVGPDVTGGDGGTGAGTDTGSGGSGASGIGKYPSLSLDQIRLFNEITGAGVDVLGTHGGVHNLWAKSRAGLTQDDAYTMKTLEELDKNPEYNENYKVTADWLKPQINPNPDAADDGTLKSPEFDIWGGKVGLQQGAMTYTSGDNTYLPSGTQIYTGPDLANKGWKAGFKVPFQQGGPVGLMSLPQGYANGGEVIEGEDTMEELTPFGGTRENVWDQVEAFDNAPQHIEEPMIGMWGEKVPLGIARRVQGYMEGLDPVKRNLIQEMMQMFHMKKMMEKQQDQDQSGQYFGPQPNEYAI